jgi:hypothetical protein
MMGASKTELARKQRSRGVIHQSSDKRMFLALRLRSSLHISATEWRQRIAPDASPGIGE